MTYRLPRLRSGEASKGRAKSKHRKSSNRLYGSEYRIFRHLKRELADTSFHFHRFLLIAMLKKHGIFSLPGPLLPIKMTGKNSVMCIKSTWTSDVGS